ncbi:FAD-dependent oxidoreductase [Pseudoruegeria sp. HB172150]|uniref:FAD-dependent oxidoreductase n=1 Tax=Pseudoruegeria sp. HB172150 TaxID=2721164 RepID=UPI00155390C5|nr:FAD-dependent oxidoreductase [Pseudoruegeria sp. HB172150]
MSEQKPAVREIRQSEDRFLSSDIFESGRHTLPRRNGTGTIPEPARDIPVYHSCDVLVVGGGPAGTSAALAAAKTGADVVVMERYNHLGGLSTGGVVIWIDRMTDWEGNQVIRGFAKEVIDRMPKEGVAGPERKLWGVKDEALAKYWRLRTSAFHGIVTWAPTLDPERLKLLSQEMLLEAGVRLVFHSWMANTIVEDGCVKGVAFESKEGRQALLAKAVVDCTGDGDVFARAGGEYEDDIEEGDVHHSANTGFMLAGVDMETWLDFRLNDPDGFSELNQLGRQTLGFFQAPYVSWRNDVALFLGPRQSGLSALNVDDQTELEIRSHRFMLSHCEFFRRHAPGFQKAWMMLSAPQLGVRHTRRLAGVSRLERGDWAGGEIRVDEVGVSPSVSPKFPVVSVPYGCLVPKRLDGLLAAGRHISCDANSHGFMREIPQCWLTGQAAGTAAGVAANRGLQPRDINVGELQAELRKQGAHVRDPDATTTQHEPSETEST